jgi:5-(carboxyamino)imidazole ribonucleotide mutase
MPREQRGRVAVLTGSANDLDMVKKIRETLAELGVGCELRVLSAHRSPELTVEYVRAAEARGIEVFVACAGMANHLAGTVAAHTRLPVIGVPLASGKLDGLDSLLSTVQMPPGVPVATVAIDGVRNAAFLAARILGIKHAAVRERLEAAARAERENYEAAHAEAEREENRRPAADPKRGLSTPAAARPAPRARVPRRRAGRAR